jgi:WD40 repeat protein
VVDLLPKVTDFGLAKNLGEAGRTQSGAIVGTPSYMAPEQADGKSRNVGPSADVYALGALLYECLTGRPPFKAATPLDTVLQVLSNEPVPVRQLQPSVPRDLETVCHKCLQKDPARRYGSALALAEDLRRFLGGEPVVARPIGIVERSVKWVKRRPALAGLLATVMVAAILLVAGGIAFTLKLDQARQVAEEEKERAEKGEADAKTQRTKAEQERDLARRNSMTAQLLLVGSIFDREPGRALALLEDTRLCPPDLRDPAWGFYYHVCRRWEPRGLTRHDEGVFCLAFSPDGKTLASGGADGVVKLWDLVTGKERSPLRGLEGWACSLAFSTDGKTLAAVARKGPDGGDGSVQFWDLPSGKPRGSLIRAHRRLRSVAFSPDGATLALSAADGTIVLWDMAQGKERLSLRGPKVGVKAAIFSPDGRTLASLAEREIRLWDAASGKELRAFKGHEGIAVSLAFSGDGKLIASASAELITNVRLWDVTSGKLLAVLNACEVASVEPITDEHGEVQGNEGVQSVAVSTDGTVLAGASSDGTVRVWDLPGAQLRVSLRAETGAHAIALAPDGASVAVACKDGTVRLWRLIQGHERISGRSAFRERRTWRPPRGARTGGRWRSPYPPRQAAR